MPVTLQCPRCTHEQSIDDDRAQSEVPCKICHHLIQPSSVKEKAKPKLAPKANPDVPSGIQKGPPPVQTSKPPAVATKKSSKSGKDDKDDDRPARRPRDTGESGTMFYVMLVGGGFVVLALMCSGAVGGYFLFAKPRPAEPIALVEVPQPVNPNPLPNPNNNPIPKPPPNPPPNPNPLPPPKPMPLPLDPNNPADVGRVLDALRGPAEQRGPALAWLNTANTNHPRRAEIAKQLDSMVDEAMKQQFGNDPFFNVYFKWATKDSTSALIRLVDSNGNGPWHSRPRHEAMRALGKAKEKNAIPSLVKRLSDHQDRGVATDTLIEIGPAAESVVLKSFNNSDGNARDAARRILQSYKTKVETIAAQCVSDLDSAEVNRRRDALQWLTTNPVEPKYKADISRSLNKMLTADNALTNRDLVVALETWGTTENTPRLIEILETTKFHHREVIRTLGKIRDPKSAKAIVKHLGFGFVSNEARNALKEMGSTAEPAVIEHFNTTADARARMECAKCLGDIGTPSVAIPALTAMAARLPQDRAFGVFAGQAIKQIESRKK